MATFDETLKRLLKPDHTYSASWPTGQSVTVNTDTIKSMKTSATERDMLLWQLRQRLDPSWRAAAGPSPMRTSKVEKSVESRLHKMQMGQYQ